MVDSILIYNVISCRLYIKGGSMKERREGTSRDSERRMSRVSVQGKATLGRPGTDSVRS